MHNIGVQVYGARAVARRLKIIPQKYISLDKSFWNRKMRTYRTFAKWLILNVVYGAYSPMVYQRTMKLRDSVKTKKIVDGMFLYQDSVMTPEKAKSKYPSYGFYFIYGGGFLAMKNAKPVRNFFDAWYKFFNRKFRLDYNNEVIKPALKGA